MPQVFMPEMTASLLSWGNRLKRIIKARENRIDKAFFHSHKHHPKEYMQRLERKHFLCIECFGKVKLMKKDFVRSVSERLSLPAEAISAVPLIQLRGKRSFSVENHGGLLEYGDTKVKIAVKGGAVTVYGKEISICRMTSRCIEIHGCLWGVELE